MKKLFLAFSTAATLAIGAGTNVTPPIGNNSVTNAKLAKMPANTIKGNNTGVTATPLDLTATQATALLNVFGADSGAGGVKGLVPATVAGDAAKVLYGDGTFKTPSSGGVTGPGSSTNTAIATYSGTGGSTLLNNDLTYSSGALTRLGAASDLTITATGDAANNATQASSIKITAPNKTGGTGVGGDVDIAAGTSTGGNNGLVRIKQHSGGNDIVYMGDLAGANTSINVPGLQVKGSGGDVSIASLGGFSGLYFGTNKSIGFEAGYIDIYSNHFEWITNNTYDVGVTGNTPRTFLAGTSVKTPQLLMKSGGGSAGTGTLSGGTVTITTSLCTTSSLVFVTDTTSGSLVNVGSLTAVAGTGSFVVTSTNALDTSTFNWMLINTY